MEKFGTPTAAGPGVASETVGLEAVGAPPGVRPGAWSVRGAPPEPDFFDPLDDVPLDCVVGFPPFVVAFGALPLVVFCREP
ncbi:MAG TPA: hypothetical protein VHR88_06740 [Solirubrobacteraceae bacterium]|jgi:hypothetical protein|nr:hypothetical protein [Solirubrobacteraceae bacterium]